MRERVSSNTQEPEDRPGLTREKSFQVFYLIADINQALSQRAAHVESPPLCITASTNHHAESVAGSARPRRGCARRNWTKHRTTPPSVCAVHGRGRWCWYRGCSVWEADAKSRNVLDTLQRIGRVCRSVGTTMWTPLRVCECDAFTDGNLD